MLPKDHPIGRVRQLADAALAGLQATFDETYSRIGRPSVPPERLAKRLLLIVLSSVRSERPFCGQLHHDMLYRRFLERHLDEEPFDATTYT